MDWLMNFCVPYNWYFTLPVTKAGLSLHGYTNFDLDSSAYVTNSICGVAISHKLLILIRIILKITFELKSI